MSPAHISGHLLPDGTQPTGVRDTDLVATEQHRLPRTLEDFASLPEVAPSASGEVVELLALFGHVVDNGAWDWLDRVFASDATYVVAGVEVLGLEAIAAYLQKRVMPPSHHTVNSAFRQAPDGSVVAWSRLVTIAGDGTVASADVVDRVASGADGPRIGHRIVQPRHGGQATSDAEAAAWVR